MEEVPLEEAGLGVEEDDEGLEDEVVEEDEGVGSVEDPQPVQSHVNPPDVLEVEEVLPEEAGLGADEVLEEDEGVGSGEDTTPVQFQYEPPDVVVEEVPPEEADAVEDDGAAGLVDDVSLPEACGLSAEVLSPELLSVLPLSGTSTGFVLPGVLAVSAGLVLSPLPVLPEPSGVLTDEL